MKHATVMVLIVVFAVFGFAFHVGAAGQKDPKALFEDACSQCHSIKVPKSEKMPRADWQDIVSRMRSNGLGISDEEAAILVDYLSAQYGK